MRLTDELIRWFAESLFHQINPHLPRVGVHDHGIVPDEPMVPGDQNNRGVRMALLAGYVDADCAICNGINFGDDHPKVLDRLCGLGDEKCIAAL